MNDTTAIIVGVIFLLCVGGMVGYAIGLSKLFAQQKKFIDLQWRYIHAYRKLEAERDRAMDAYRKVVDLYNNRERDSGEEWKNG